MHELIGPQIEQIQNALLSGYDQDSLRRLVRIHLNEDLHEIVGGANFTDRVFNLILWAEKQGRIVDLVRAAAANNPNNPALQTAWADVQRWSAPASVPATTPTTLNPVLVAPQPKVKPGLLATLRAKGWVAGIAAVLVVMAWGGYTLLNRLPALLTPTLTPASAPSPTVAVEATLSPTSQPAAAAVATPVARPTDTATPAPTATALPTPTPESLHTLRLDSGVEFTFVRVPAGEFTMGSTDQQIDAAVALCNQYLGDVYDCTRDRYINEAPQHSIRLDKYWIMQTEVTNGQYRAFIDSDGYRNEAYWSSEGWVWRTDNNIDEPAYWNDNSLNLPDQPVVGVSWYEADAFARWLATTTDQVIRLPSEAEWEKAARGTDRRTFPWGNAWNVTQATPLVNYCDQRCANDWKDDAVDDGYSRTAPVGSFPVGASPYGAFDLAGNVWEWVADFYDAKYYETSPERNPPGPASGDSRVARGGSWGDISIFVRTAIRLRLLPDDRSDSLGFRLVFAGF